VLTNRDLDLVKERLDVAIRVGPLADSGLVARRVGHVRRVLFASPDYLARRGRPRTLRDLIKHEIVFYSDRPTQTIWRFRAAGRERIVRVEPRLMVTDADALLFAARSGRGRWEGSFLSGGRRLFLGNPGSIAVGVLNPPLARFILLSQPHDTCCLEFEHYSTTSHLAWMFCP